MKLSKRPVKLIEWAKIIILLLPVPAYDFELLWVVLHPSVKKRSKSFINNSIIAMFCRHGVILAGLEISLFYSAK